MVWKPVGVNLADERRARHDESASSRARRCRARVAELLVFVDIARADIVDPHFDQILAVHVLVAALGQRPHEFRRHLVNPEAHDLLAIEWAIAEVRHRLDELGRHFVDAELHESSTRGPNIPRPAST